MELTIFDRAVLRLVDPEEPMEKLATGYVFCEGPVYRDGVHHFTDFQVNKIYRYQDGKAECVNDDSYFTIGLTYDRVRGRILGCTREKHAITNIETGEIIVDQYNGVRLNGSNDVIVDSKGRIYFSDPLSRKIEGEQIGHSSVFRYTPETGEMDSLETTLTYPNGLALSPDEKTLYIVDTNSIAVYSLDLANGSFKLFAQLEESLGEGRPDGMRVDIKGNLYVTGPAGIWILAPDGKALGVIHTPERAANLCFDDTGLFITATSSVYHVRTKVPSAC